MEIVFVHGALVRDGRWWWQPTARLVHEQLGIESRAVELPSCGETGTGAAAGGLVDDARALRDLLDGLDAAVVVGHSYGGTVIAQAGAHPAIAHVLYVSSYLPVIGQSQADIMKDELDPVRIGDNGDGTVTVSGYDAESFGARFLHDADEAVQRQAWTRVTSQSIGAFTTPTTTAGWEGVESTYLVCTQDRSTSVALQRDHAARTQSVVEVDAGHHPFITRPEVVAERIALLARAI